jgi:Alginate export
MNRNKSHLSIVSGLLAWGMAFGAQAQEGVTGDLDKIVSEGSVKLDLRYRFENVDDDNFKKDANASTLRTRVTFQSGNIYGFDGLVEFDNVTYVGNDNFNSTENGVLDRPVVADPKGTEVNQAKLTYTWNDLVNSYGRQRILHGSQRFVGGVAWRQNEQTYDGFRAKWGNAEAVQLDYAYVYNINRIFGPDDRAAQPANWHGENHLLRLDWTPFENHKLTGFYYGLEIDERSSWVPNKSVNNSSDTWGVEYSGKLGPVAAKAAWATQSDAGDSYQDYDADYYMIEGGMNIAVVNVKLGYEVLGAGDGVGFKTPLATLHKFQGWADKFLVTPDDGIEDLYVGATGKFGPVKLGAFYHDFQAEDSSNDYGTELDLVATWPINKQFSTQLKYANFSSDIDSMSDTEKLWVTLQLKL